jgi:hypothetical protein
MSTYEKVPVHTARTRLRSRRLGIQLMACAVYSMSDQLGAAGFKEVCVPRNSGDYGLYAYPDDDSRQPDLLCTAENIKGGSNDINLFRPTPMVCLPPEAVYGCDMIEAERLWQTAEEAASHVLPLGVGDIASFHEQLTPAEARRAEASHYCSMPTEHFHTSLGAVICSPCESHCSYRERFDWVQLANERAEQAAENLREHLKHNPLPMDFTPGDCN